MTESGGFNHRFHVLNEQFAGRPELQNVRIEVNRDGELAFRGTIQTAAARNQIHELLTESQIAEERRVWDFVYVARA